MNPVDLNSERFYIVNHYLRGRMFDLIFPDVAYHEFDIFSYPSPQQLPFHRCPTRPERPPEYQFFVPRNDERRIQTRNGYYEITEEHPIYHPTNYNVTGYFRKFRFCYENPPCAFGPIQSTWIVEEFSLNPNITVTHNRDFNLTFCKVQKVDPLLIFPPVHQMDVPDSDLMHFYLKKNILGLHIPGDPIPSFEVFSAPSPRQLPLHLCRFTNTKNDEWHFFCHRRDGPLIPTRFGYYKFNRFAFIFDRHHRLCGSSRTLIYYDELPHRPAVMSEWSIKQFIVYPSILGDEQHDHFISQLASELVICKVCRKLPRQRPEPGFPKALEPGRLSLPVVPTRQTETRVVDLISKPPEVMAPLINSC